MRIVITGSDGQLGRALQSVFSSDDLYLVDLPRYDITKTTTIVPTLRAFRPELVIHCAAMTNVDGCERDPRLAESVNVVGTRNMGLVAGQSGCPMVYVSTDYVFDGAREGETSEWDRPSPQSVYARTKWLGEEAARQLVGQLYVVRVAWLYGDGPRNFVRTVLRLAQEGGPLRMVTDECGSPTYAVDVARALARLVTTAAYGTYHLPNAGVCSRYDWAATILELAGLREGVDLEPMTNYQRAAVVPKRVALRNYNGAHEGIVMRPWLEALAEYMRLLQGE